jgi:hypothetical protein
VKQSWVIAVLLGLLVGGINWLGRGVVLGSPEPFVLRDLATDLALMLVLSASLAYFFQGAAASHGDLRRAVKRTAMAFGVAAVVSGVVAILALSQTAGHPSTSLYIGVFLSYAMWPGGFGLGLLAMAYSRAFVRVLDAESGQGAHRDRTPTTRSS